MTVALPGALDIAIRPEHYQRLAEKIAGKPEERIVSYLMLRSLKQARYRRRSARPFRAGVRSLHTFHVTDPPLSDLIVHRVLKWALDHPEARPVASPGPVGLEERRLCDVRPLPPRRTRGHRRGNFRDERRAETAERELMAWKTAQFMEQHLGEEYDALIISVQKFGFFVELMEVFVEGIVPITRIEELTGEQVFLPRARSRDR